MPLSYGEDSYRTGTGSRPGFEALEPRLLLSASATFVEVDNTSELSGYKTYDLQVTTDEDWRVGALYLTLTEGTIYQDAYGGDGPLLDVQIGFDMSVVYDTYVGRQLQYVGIAGGAGDLGGPALRFDDQVLSVSWFNTKDGDTGTISVARITLSDDAVGTWSYRMTVGDLSDSGTITAGVFAGSDPGSEPEPEPTEPEPEDTDPDVLGVHGDFDYDGDVDIVWRNNSTGETVIWSLEDAAFESSNTLTNATTDTDWVTVGMGDFTGDGKTDTLWRNTVDGRLFIEMTEDGVGGQRYDLNTVSDLRWQVVAVADMTGDGQLDIIWRHATNGRNIVWEMNGTDRQQNHRLKRLKNTDCQIVGAGDFDGDGATDLLWRNTRNGRNLVWHMQGTQYHGMQQIKRMRSQNWQIAQVADFTGDGKTDILWRNTANGKNMIWRMNNTRFSDIVRLPNVTDQDWQIAGSMLGLWEN